MRQLPTLTPIPNGKKDEASNFNFVIDKTTTVRLYS